MKGRASGRPDPIRWRRRSTTSGASEKDATGAVADHLELLKPDPARPHRDYPEAYPDLTGPHEPPQATSPTTTTTTTTSSYPSIAPPRRTTPSDPRAARVFEPRDLARRLERERIKDEVEATLGKK